MSSTTAFTSIAKPSASSTLLMAATAFSPGKREEEIDVVRLERILAALAQLGDELVVPVGVVELAALLQAG